MTPPLGVGIIGGGTIGAVHATAIDQIDEMRLVAIAEPRETIGRELASRHAVEWLPSLDALLDRADIDCVILATPSGLHPEQGILAAQRGKHVVTEKPMAISLDGADRMIAACDRAEVSLAVIFQNRFARDAIRLNRAIAAGLLGRPLLGSAIVHWHRKPAYYDAAGGWRGSWALDGGGALMNQSIHTIDLLSWMLGPVESLFGETATLSHTIEAEDTASATLRFASGALGTIQGTTAANADHPARVEIVGTAGRAILANGQLTEWQTDAGRDIVAALTEHGQGDPPGVRPGAPFGEAHRWQLRAIATALQAGTPPPVSGRAARAALEIILSIYQSARSGQRVQLGPTAAASR